MDLIDLLSISPVGFLVLWALLVLLIDLWLPRRFKGVTPLFASLGLAIDLGLNISLSALQVSGFSGMMRLDGFAVFLNLIFLGSGLVGVALAYDYLKRMNAVRGEYYALILFSVCGMMLMAQADDLILVFLALELLSIPLYVLAGFLRGNLLSQEAALKYFLLGAFASGFLLYGIAMVYGATSYTNLTSIAQLVNGAHYPGLLLLGAGFILVGFGFKVAASPFNLWVPDVYQGAPTPVTGFMSVAVKAAGFAGLMRVFILAFPSLSSDLTPLLWGLAALTMLVGNLVALLQTNMKRMLAYSSIAHAGYLLMGFVSFGNGAVVGSAVSAMLFYLLGYGLTSFAAWAVVIALEQVDGKGVSLSDYKGLGKRQPLLALTMAAAMLSFTGIPITVGFWGKLFLFRSALEGGFIGLVLVGLAAAVVSAYYYLRVIAMMYMHTGEPEVRRDGWLNLTALVSALAVVGLGFIPYIILQAVSTAVIQLP